jgi:hypothetical protein
LFPQSSLSRPVLPRDARAREKKRARDRSARALAGEWSTNAAALLSADNSQHLQWSPVCNFRFEKR